MEEQERIVRLCVVLATTIGIQTALGSLVLYGLARWIAKCDLSFGPILAAFLSVIVWFIGIMTIGVIGPLFSAIGVFVSQAVINHYILVLRTKAQISWSRAFAISLGQFVAYFVLMIPVMFYWALMHSAGAGWR